MAIHYWRLAGTNMVRVGRHYFGRLGSIKHQLTVIFWCLFLKFGENRW